MQVYLHRALSTWQRDPGEQDLVFSLGYPLHNLLWRTESVVAFVEGLEVSGKVVWCVGERLESKLQKDLRK